MSLRQRSPFGFSSADGWALSVSVVLSGKTYSLGCSCMGSWIFIALLLFDKAGSKKFKQSAILPEASFRDSPQVRLQGLRDYDRVWAA